MRVHRRLITFVKIDRGEIRQFFRKNCLFSVRKDFLGHGEIYKNT